MAVMTNCYQLEIQCDQIDDDDDDDGKKNGLPFLC